MEGGFFQLTLILVVSRTVMWFVSLLVTAKEEPLQVFNGKLWGQQPQGAGKHPRLDQTWEKEALLFRPDWVLCSSTWNPGNLLPGLLASVLAHLQSVLHTAARPVY